MITRDDLKKAHTRGTLFLDGEGFYQNHFQCVEYGRLTIVDSGPARRYGTKKKGEVERKHERKFFVDGMECPDIDAVLTMLNAEPQSQQTTSLPE